MEPTTTILALVYLVATGGGLAIGDQVAAGEPIPPAARGLLLRGLGTVQLGEGAQASVTDDGRIDLEAGQLRLAAQSTMVVIVGPVALRISASEAHLSASPEGLTVCALLGEVTVTGASLPRPDPPPAAAPAEVATPESATPAAPAAAAPAALSIAAGTCRLVADGIAGEPSPVEAGALGALASEVAAAPRPLADVPDAVGDPSAELAEIEEEWAEQMERGARREAAACGCSEDGGGGGSLDSGGSGTPNPDPEQPDPGTLRIRVRIPAR